MTARNAVLLSIATALIAVTGYGAVYSNRPVKPTAAINTTVQAPTPEAITPSELLRLVNIEREKVGVQPLIMDERLNASAQRKADEMVKTGVNEHVNAAGVHGYSYAYESASPICKRAGENLVYGSPAAYNTAESTVQGWVKSPAHYKAMIDPTSVYTGFGVNNDRRVEHFCMP